MRMRVAKQPVKVNGKGFDTRQRPLLLQQ